ncbi:hypothetical protein V5799_012968 [Amblyomma americanum]|uniref:Uncharacterized protein n=1 Tax=Amblyomma americanum TaxID=6943 RepID=A0AAQ4E759_AMBAM
MTPAKENMTPAEDHMTPAKDQMTPAKGQMTLPKGKMSPAKVEMSLAKEQMTPAKDHMMLAKEQMTPAKEQMTSAKEKMTLVTRHGATSTKGSSRENSDGCRAGGVHERPKMDSSEDTRDGCNVEGGDGLLIKGPRIDAGDDYGAGDRVRRVDGANRLFYCNVPGTVHAMR